MNVTIPPMPEAVTPSTFAFQALANDGSAIVGTINAPALADATAKLLAMQLRVTQLQPVSKPNGRPAFGADDFLAFNQQLAHLTAGGLPVERGLRLLAGEMSSARQKAAIDAVATELEKGVPVGAAFAAHRSHFPPLYGRLIDAGIAANDLPGVLLNLGRRMTMVSRLRSALWRAGTYPICVAVALLAVLCFIWFVIIPQIEPMGVDFRNHMSRFDWTTGVSTKISSPMDTVVPIARGFSYMVIFVLALFLVFIAILAVTTKSIAGRRMTEPLLVRLPLIGPILRLNLLARWCDALHMGVTAGLNLSAAIGLASDAVDSPRLAIDGNQMIEALVAGRKLDGLKPGRLIPPVVPTALQTGSEQSDLPAATRMLASMYQEQAELRLSVLPAILSPLLLLITAVSVCTAVVCAMLPLIVAIQWLTR